MHDNIYMFIMEMIIYMSKLEEKEMLCSAKRKREQWRKLLYEEHP
jgi:hypothetical protein